MNNPTFEQVSLYLKAMAYDLQTPNPFKSLEEKQVIIEKYAHEIAELGSGTCNPVETEVITYYDEYGHDAVKVHVMECNKCGGTYEHVNGDYERCPRCGKAVER